MLIAREEMLKDLIESKDGIHLTGYLVNKGTPDDLRAQLRGCLLEAEEFLDPVMTADEKRRFLEPMNNLYSDGQLLQKIRGNVGLFRTHEAFRILSLPIPVEPQCIVATTFHVKPLIKWMQSDQMFLVLRIDRRAAHLYVGSQHSLIRAGSWRYQKPLPARRAGPAGNRGASLTRFERNAMGEIHEWVRQMTLDTVFPMYVSGDGILVREFIASSKYANLKRAPTAHDSTTNELSKFVDDVRDHLRDEADARIKRVFFEFHQAEVDNRSRRNIFQIAEAAVHGQVKKLIVADGVNIFGRIDPATGGVAIHPCHLDHEDDDLLDDLAQTVLQQGGEVMVVNPQEIPQGRPILAILNDDGPRRPRAKLRSPQKPDVDLEGVS